MALSKNTLIITDKTDITDTPTNEEFLKQVFRDIGDNRPFVASFHGNPETNGRWGGKALDYDNLRLPPNANNYFSLATFDADEAGKYRRKKDNFSSLYAIMLDDIGTKAAPKEELALEPSWLIETSQGNYQAGYVLHPPIRDSGLAEKVINAFTDKGMCDPGAKGLATRYARLPVAVNGKYEPAFQCRMELWNPEIAYSIESLIKAYDLDLDSKTNKRKKKSRPKLGESIFVPKPTENIVINALKASGLYKAALEEGHKHNITCPWVHEHTEEVDGGTAYFEPDEEHPIGGFHCFHGHCEQRGIRDLLGFLDIDAEKAGMRSIIRNTPGQLHNIVDKAEQELNNPGIYYQRGGVIVTITRDPSTEEIFVKPLSKPALLSSLSSVTSWEKYIAGEGIWVRTDPPDKVVSVLFDNISYSHLANLNGITHQPYLRDDGTITLQAGYDSASGMFGAFDSSKYALPELPTKKDAKKALGEVEKLLEEFPFATEYDQAAAISAILTAAIRPSLPLAPMFHIRAHQIGSGKSFLSEMTGLFATAQRNTPCTFPYDDEECRKLLLAQLMRSPAVIEFDNLTTDISAHKSLCVALTSEHMTDRVLGVSKTATISTRTLFLSSGNNVSPVGDMTRRCITINLDPVCETPASREFKNPYIMQQLRDKRESYVSAALTIILAWIHAGRPQTECKPIANYNQWSDLCRQTLLWLGLEDPAHSIFEAMQDDPNKETLGCLLVCWHRHFGNGPKMIKDLVNVACGDEELEEIIHDIALERGTLNRRRLGHWVKRHAGQIVNGLRFVKYNSKLSATAWIVESVS